MSDTNKAAVRGYIEEVMNKGQGDVSKFDKYVASNAVLHNPYPAAGSDINAWKDRVRMFAAAFTDIHVTVEDQIYLNDVRMKSAANVSQQLRRLDRKQAKALVSAPMKRFLDETDEPTA